MTVVERRWRRAAASGLLPLAALLALGPAATDAFVKPTNPHLGARPSKALEASTLEAAPQSK